MWEVVDVRIPNTGKTSPFLLRDLAVKRGVHCVVETEHGTEFGLVVRENHSIPMDNLPGLTNVVIRQATPSDVSQYLDTKEREKRIFAIVREQIEKRQLVMKLIKTEVLLGSSKVVVYYTADGRVDFRELLKSLVVALHCRIEMRQIGSRVAAKMLGGVGICGRAVCCFTFLQDFEPVSLKSSRMNRCCQNPSKLSGICGKLRCCHTYEEPQLVQIKGE